MNNIAIKYLKTILLCLLALVAATSCKSDSPEPERPTLRTILVYIVANNSLGEELTYEKDHRSHDNRDLDEMLDAARTGQLGDCRWIVYHHPYRSTPELKELTRDGFKTIKTYTTDIASTTIERMTEVISDTKTVAPAPDYGLILWSHASGWIEDGIDEPQVKTRSFGDDNYRRMNITSLRRAVENENFSFIYTDCCNMSSVEVAYELRNATKTFAGSVTELPGDGMPYDLTVKYFTATTPDIVAAARTTFDYYNSLPANELPWCTISVINTAGLDQLARETKRVYSSSQYPRGYRPQAFDFVGRYYFDLKHFVDALSPDDKAWNTALNNTVLYQAAMPRFLNLYIDHHCGLSTFLQNNKSDAAFKNYDQLQWYKDVACEQPLP